MVTLLEIIYAIIAVMAIYVVWFGIQLVAGLLYDRREEKLRGLPRDVREIID